MLGSSILKLIEPVPPFEPVASKAEITAVSFRGIVKSTSVWALDSPSVMIAYAGPVK